MILLLQNRYLYIHNTHIHRCQFWTFLRSPLYRVSVTNVKLVAKRSKREIEIRFLAKPYLCSPIGTSVLSFCKILGHIQRTPDNLCCRLLRFQGCVPSVRFVPKAGEVGVKRSEKGNQKGRRSRNKRVRQW